MAGLRHTSSIGVAATSSPQKRDSADVTIADASHPFVSERKSYGQDESRGGGRVRGRCYRKYQDLYSQSSFRKAFLLSLFTFVLVVVYSFVPLLWDLWYYRMVC